MAVITLYIISRNCSTSTKYSCQLVPTQCVPDTRFIKTDCTKNNNNKKSLYLHLETIYCK